MARAFGLTEPMHSFTNSAVDDLGDERMAFDPSAEEASWAMLQVFLARSFEQAALAL